MSAWEVEFQMVVRTGAGLTISSFTKIDSQWMPVMLGEMKPFAADDGALAWMESQFRDGFHVPVERGLRIWAKVQGRVVLVQLNSPLLATQIFNRWWSRGNANLTLYGEECADARRQLQPLELAAAAKTTEFTPSEV